MFYTFFAQYIYNMLYQNIVHISIDLIKKIEICKRWMSRRAGDQDELELIPHHLKCIREARCFVNGTQMSSLYYPADHWFGYYVVDLSIHFFFEHFLNKTKLINCCHSRRNYSVPL